MFFVFILFDLHMVPIFWNTISWHRAGARESPRAWPALGSKYPKGPDSPQPPWCGSIITREEKKYGASLVLPCATKGPRGNPPSTRQNRAEGLCDAASHVTLPFSKKTKNRAAKGLWQITYPPGPPLAEGGRTRFSQFMSKEGRRGFFQSEKHPAANAVQNRLLSFFDSPSITLAHSTPPPCETNQAKEIRKGAHRGD